MYDYLVNVDTLNKSVEFNSQPRDDDGYTVSTQYCLLSKEESALSWDGWSLDSVLGYVI